MLSDNRFYILNGEVRQFCTKLTLRWSEDDQGLYHSHSGKPSIESKNAKWWHLHGVIHNFYGPAFIHNTMDFGVGEYYVYGIRIYPKNNLLSDVVHLMVLCEDI